MSVSCFPTLSNTNAALSLLTTLLSTKASQVSHVCKAGANDCLRYAECRVNYALRVCARVHAFLRANLQSLGQLLFFGFLTQGRISSATLLSSLPHGYTALCASNVHAVLYLTLHLCSFFFLTQGRLSSATLFSCLALEPSLVAPSHKTSCMH